MSEVILLDPTGVARVKTAAKVRKLKTLQGTMIGLVANGKTWGFTFFDELGSVLQKQFGVAEVKHFRKDNSNSAAPAALLDTIAAGCDAAVDGIQD